MSDPDQALYADPIAYWNGPAGTRWVEQQAETDRLLAPFGEAAMRRAAIKPGERVLDVGCGCGTQSGALLDAVGPSGSVVGVDVSAPMLARARHLFERAPNIAFVEADAARYHPAPLVDLVFSRFGVMFFPDPIAAFTNLREALHPGGRLTFVCWRALADNPWMRVPLEAAGTIVTLPPADPDEPGPFAFASESRVRPILEATGFEGVTFERFDCNALLSEQGLDGAVTSALRTGLAGRVADQLDDEGKVRLAAAVRTALAPHVTSDRVTLPASGWIVTATRV